MAKDTDQEPSIEEILNSIRQIISDDDDSAPPAPEEPAPVFTPEPVAAQPFEQDDVIELMDRVEEEQDISFAESEPDIEIEMRETPQEPEPEDQYIPEEEEAPPPPPPRKAPEARPAPRPAPQPEPEADSVFTRQAEDAAFGAFSELARKTAVEYGGITLEEIVRSELKPMLRDWLDRHLPSMIERLVQEELERVSKRVIGD